MLGDAGDRSCRGGCRCSRPEPLWILVYRMLAARSAANLQVEREKWHAAIARRREGGDLARGARGS